MRYAAIIHNPHARTAPKRQRLLDAVASMRDEGWLIDLMATDCAGHGVDLAREAARAGAEAVFACGGDGTINEVVNGIAGSEASLAVLRGGMGNVFAKEIGVKRAPERALRVLIDGERRCFDVGVAGDRYFLLMAGIGFDASIVRRVPSHLKQKLGSTSYAIYGLQELARYRPYMTSLNLDGAEWAGAMYWALLGNTRSYGGVLNITHRAVVDDGELDAYVFAGGGLGWVGAMALRLLLRRQDGGEGVSFQRVRHFEVETPGLPVQADGEYFGETPMRFSVVPQALYVLAPPGRLAHLFSSASGEPIRHSSFVS